MIGTTDHHAQGAGMQKIHPKLLESCRPEGRVWGQGWEEALARAVHLGCQCVSVSRTHHGGVFWGLRGHAENKLWNLQALIESTTLQKLKILS